MKPKRIFQVYKQQEAAPADGTRTFKPARQVWRWRLVATRNGQIVGGSQEAFDSRGNAMRAARKEASLYQPGAAAVEVV